MDLDRYFEISESRTLQTLERRLVSMAHDFGFGVVSGALVVENQLDRSKTQVHAFGNIPQEFEEASFRRESVARDPVLKRLKSLSVPFLYDQSLYVKEGAGDLWEEQAAFGYRTGVAVALHLPGGRHFLLGFDRSEALPSDGGQLSRLMADLQLLAVHAQAAASTIWTPHSGEPPPKFSHRELEILRWTQAGKSAWETGQILGISDQGVKHHLRSILLKLDVSSKHQAVLKAISLGVI